MSMRKTTNEAIGAFLTSRFRGHEERVRKHSQHSPLYSPGLVHE